MSEYPDIAPLGYEFTGECRAPKSNEYYLSSGGGLCRAHADRDDPRQILRPVAKPLELEDFSKPTQPQLPEPKPGHEWAVLETAFNGHRVVYEQTPIRKLYDWSKTGPNVLVLSSPGNVQTRMAVAPDPQQLIEGVWQAHIGGDPCPVDPDATMVEDCCGLRVVASRVDWSRDVIYRVTGTVEGYSYDC